MKLMVTVAVFAIAAIPGPNASAATFLVTAKADVADANPGDGVCNGIGLEEPTACSLRAAVNEVNKLSVAAPEEDFEILLPPGTYRLKPTPGSEVFDQMDAEGKRNDLDLVAPKLTIRGIRPDGSPVSPEERPTIMGERNTTHGFRIFHIHSTGNPLRFYKLIDLKLSNAQARAHDGNGIGGAILCEEGFVDIVRTRVGSATSERQGAGIASSCNLGLEDSQVSMTRTEDPNFSAAAVYLFAVDAPASAGIIRSSISENVANSGLAARSYGAPLTVSVSSSTIAQNSKNGIYLHGAQLLAKNVTVWGNAQGIAIDTNGTLTIDNSIAANSSESWDIRLLRDSSTLHSFGHNYLDRIGGHADATMVTQGTDWIDEGPLDLERVNLDNLSVAFQPDLLSPVRGEGDPDIGTAAPGDCAAVDQANRNRAPVCDIGAMEARTVGDDWPPFPVESDFVDFTDGFEEPAGSGNPG